MSQQDYSLIIEFDKVIIQVQYCKNLFQNFKLSCHRSINLGNLEYQKRVHVTNFDIKVMILWSQVLGFKFVSIHWNVLKNDIFYTDFNLCWEMAQKIGSHKAKLIDGLSERR